MSDLSQLLGDLYADESPTRAPAWSSEEALDEAFSSWVPGPPADSPSAERSILSEAIESLPSAPIQPDADVADWLMNTEPAAEVVPEPVLRWSPTDDDILPAKSYRRSRRRRLFDR